MAEEVVDDGGVEVGEAFRKVGVVVDEVEDAVADDLVVGGLVFDFCRLDEAQFNGLIALL